MDSGYTRVQSRRRYLCFRNFLIFFSSLELRQGAVEAAVGFVDGRLRGAARLEKRSACSHHSNDADAQGSLCNLVILHVPAEAVYIAAEAVGAFWQNRTPP